MSAETFTQSDLDLAAKRGFLLAALTREPQAVMRVREQLGLSPSDRMSIADAIDVLTNLVTAAENYGRTARAPTFETAVIAFVGDVANQVPNALSLANSSVRGQSTFSPNPYPAPLPPPSLGQSLIPGGKE